MDRKGLSSSEVIEKAPVSTEKCTLTCLFLSAFKCGEDGQACACCVPTGPSATPHTSHQRQPPPLAAPCLVTIFCSALAPWTRETEGKNPPTGLHQTRTCTSPPPPCTRQVGPRGSGSQSPSRTRTGLNRGPAAFGTAGPRDTQRGSRPGHRWASFLSPCSVWISVLPVSPFLPLHSFQNKAR